MAQEPPSEAAHPSPGWVAYGSNGTADASPASIIEGQAVLPKSCRPGALVIYYSHLGWLSAYCAAGMPVTRWLNREAGKSARPMQEQA